jgi:NTP pyrophosphatase (non-canonical NTP hydrolase)
MVDMNQYQSAALSTALDSASNLNYVALGLAGEAGEFANKIKKRMRDDRLDTKGAIDELGDCLWYIAVAAYLLGVDLSSVAHLNMEKLEDRQARAVIQGAGDYR